MSADNQSAITKGVSAPKKLVTKTNSPKASPSSQTSSVTTSSATRRKFARTSVYGKPSTEFSEDTIRDLKKNITMLNDENLILKSKLRRSEEDNIRKEKYILQLQESTKNDNDKAATNSAISQLKRKIQKLELTLKEREVVIRQLQNDARIAALNDARSNFRKEPVARSPSSQRILPPSSAGNRITRLNSTNLQAENDRLKQQLRRALSIDESHITQYGDLGTDELISFIVRLNQDVENLKKSGRDPQLSSAESTSLETKGEMEKLQLEIRKLKEDRLSYFEESESKRSEIKALKQEIDKLNKEFANSRESARKSVSSPSPTTKRTTGFLNPRASPPQTTHTLVKSAPAKIEKGSEVTVRTSTVSKTKSTPPSHTVKKTETRRVTTTVTKVSTSSPVKATATKVSVNISKKGPVKLPSKEEASVDIEKKISSLIKAEEPCAAEISREDQVSVEKPVADEREVREFQQSVAAKKIQRKWRQHNAEAKQVYFNSHSDKEPVTNKDADVEKFAKNLAAKKIQRKWRAYHEKDDGKGDVEELISNSTTDSEGFGNNISELPRDREESVTIPEVTKGPESNEDKFSESKMNGE